MFHPSPLISTVPAVMSVLHLSLLGFALWTLAVLVFTIGVHRLGSVVSGKAAMNAFPADAPTGPGWYRRATRAHANCLENLPVFAAIVVVATVTGTGGAALDVLGVVLLLARIAQTVTHVAFVETPRAVTVRFSFFLVQLLAMITMGVAVLHAAA